MAPNSAHSLGGQMIINQCKLNVLEPHVLLLAAWYCNIDDFNENPIIVSPHIPNINVREKNKCMQSNNELNIIHCLLKHIKIHYVNKQPKWMYFLWGNDWIWILTRLAMTCSKNFRGRGATGKEMWATATQSSILYHFQEQRVFLEMIYGQKIAFLWPITRGKGI